MSMPSTLWTAILAYPKDPEHVKELVVRRYGPAIHEFCRHQGLIPEDAEDVTQEVCIEICQDKFFQKINRAKGRFRNLILAVTRHSIQSLREYQLAGKRDRRRELPLGKYDLPEDPPSDSAFDRIWAENLVRQAKEALGDDPHLRALLLQADGKSYEEIASEMGCKLTDVRNYLHRGKERLRREIERQIDDYRGEGESREEVLSLLRII